MKCSLLSSASKQTASWRNRHTMGRDEAQRSALDEAFKLVAFGSIQINTTVVPYADDRNQARRRGMASAAAAAEAAANSVNSVREHRRGEECSPLPPTPPPPPPLLPAPAAAPPLRYYSRPPSHLFLHCLVVLLLCGSRQCFVDCDIFSSSAHIQSLMHLYVWVVVVVVCVCVALVN